MAGRFRWAPLLRLLLGLALIAWLARSIGLESIRSALTPIREHPAWIGAALALTFAALFAGDDDVTAAAAPSAPVRVLDDGTAPADLPRVADGLMGLIALMLVLYLVAPTAQQMIAMLANLRLRLAAGGKA